MTRSRKILLALAFVFFLPLLILVVDVVRRTTFPGGKNRSKEPSELEKKDTSKSISSPKSAVYQP